MIYLPPEAHDVPALMAALVAWARRAEADGLPPPLIAGLAHYQFVTIHPYYDGNGRTARLLATFILQRGGYGLHGFFSLEEQHARDLAAYYASLATHPHHNYYAGRAEADVTAWLGYFMQTLAQVFGEAKTEAVRLTQAGAPTEPSALRQLDARARRVLSLFANAECITTAEAAKALGLAPRTTRALLQQWVTDSWLVVANPSNRARAYKLSAVYRLVTGEIAIRSSDSKQITRQLRHTAHPKPCISRQGRLRAFVIKPHRHASL